MKDVKLLLLFSYAISRVHCRIAQVHTSQGTYQANTTLPNLDQFLSIPYAAPPLGNLRFAPPIPYTGSPSNVINATTRGPGCLTYPTSAGSNGLSEDCLTLDIIRPSSRPSNSTISSLNTTNNTTSPTRPAHEKLLPVIIFIFGGANINGESAWYDGSNLATHALDTDNPILYITFNFRLGGFGWLYNSLFASEDLLNIGLKDQRMALKWVRKNIAAFGGDPDRVALMGQSSGAFDVWMHMRGEVVEGERLFGGAVCMSGAPASLALKAHTPSDGDDYFDQTLAAVGCTNSSTPLACLRNASAETLSRVWFDASSSLYETLDQFVQQPVGFAVDGSWITTPYYWSEEVAAVPLINGNVLNEGSLYATAASNITDRGYLIAVVAKDLNTTDLSLAAPVVATYYNHTPAQNGRGFNASSSLSNAYYIGEAILGDTVQDIPRRVLSAYHSEIAPTWSYRFLQKPPLSVFNEPFYPGLSALPDVIKDGLGVIHASDLAFVLGDILTFADATEGDKEVARVMMDMWLAFAYFRDPNCHGGNISYWEQYDPQDAKVFQFENQGAEVSGLRPDEVRLDSYEAYREAVERAGLPLLPRVNVLPGG